MFPGMRKNITKEKGHKPKSESKQTQSILQMSWQRAQRRQEDIKYEEWTNTGGGTKGQQIRPVTDKDKTKTCRSESPCINRWC